MGSGGSGSKHVRNTEGTRDDGYRMVHGFSTHLNKDAQGKHIEQHKNYVEEENRSIFTGAMARAQELITKYAGTGYWPSENKEIVDFQENIGFWLNVETGERLPTTRGTIHYGKNGAHIVPAHPREEE